MPMLPCRAALARDQGRAVRPANCSLSAKRSSTLDLREAKAPLATTRHLSRTSLNGTKRRFDRVAPTSVFGAECVLKSLPRPMIFRPFLNSSHPSRPSCFTANTPETPIMSSAVRCEPRTGKQKCLVAMPIHARSIPMRTGRQS